MTSHRTQAAARFEAFRRGLLSLAYRMRGGTGRIDHVYAIAAPASLAQLELHSHPLTVPCL